MEAIYNISHYRLIVFSEFLRSGCGLDVVITELSVYMLLHSTGVSVHLDPSVLDWGLMGKAQFQFF